MELISAILSAIPAWESLPPMVQVVISGVGSAVVIYALFHKQLSHLIDRFVGKAPEDDTDPVRFF